MLANLTWWRRVSEMYGGSSIDSLVQGGDGSNERKGLFTNSCVELSKALLVTVIGKCTKEPNSHIVACSGIVYCILIAQQCA